MHLITWEYVTWPQPCFIKVSLCPFCLRPGASAGHSASVIEGTQRSQLLQWGGTVTLSSASLKFLGHELTYLCARCATSIAFHGDGELFLRSLIRTLSTLVFFFRAVTLRCEWRGEWFHFHYYTCHISELPKYSFIFLILVPYIKIKRFLSKSSDMSILMSN